jgi:hypothetical protein
MAQGNIWGGAGNQLAALYGRSGSSGGVAVRRPGSVRPTARGAGTGLAYGNQDYGQDI